ncbi:NAD-reducing hydrogenase large subunit [Candidatus Hakubella thermalkaliphila]|uniref:NAD-reducing hydrogenase large subunit n=2 Tax=Candidatus Hakubella thermalkaliphila TaxID=2754717 RepID=A0A6V8NEL3_9ACTN|nr:NAD-reducing hydrogenase large subunit [Candidatus Hakubella thermalkaliphila]
MPVSQKITIEPVTRIEGHAKVTIHLDDEGEVACTYFHVNEFRGLEKFCEGRMFFEMPMITQRICGICPVSHHLAAAKTCDAILGVEIPRPARLLRELMHMAQFVQSHSMHFFYLAGPDLLLGMEADTAKRNLLGLVESHPQLALQAVKLRKFGQSIIERLGGKRVHPSFAVAGGVNSALHPADRDVILKEVEEATPMILSSLKLFRDWYDENQELVWSFASFPSAYMGLVDDNGSLELYDGSIRIKDENGNTIVDRHDPTDYLSLIAEHVEDWSYLKFPYYRALGWPQGSYRVGPLGRLNVVDSVGTPLAQEEFERFKALSDGMLQGSMLYHYARLIEDLYAAERIAELLHDPEILSTDILSNSDQITGEGVGVIEAPRGTLIHHYKTDETGKLTKVNLIVATGHNNWAMGKAVEVVARQYIRRGKLTEGLLNRVEAAIRCYDPCLSCATHALGEMPLKVQLISSRGEFLGELSRSF